MAKIWNKKGHESDVKRTHFACFGAILVQFWDNSGHFDFKAESLAFRFTF